MNLTALELAQFPVTARGCLEVREADLRARQLSLDFLSLYFSWVVVRVMVVSSEQELDCASFYDIDGAN